jgi:hypothetical protein
MEFHVLTDKGAVLICTVEGREVTIPEPDSKPVKPSFEKENSVPQTAPDSSVFIGSS